MSDNGRVSVLFFFTVGLYFLLGEINNVASSIPLSLHAEAVLLAFFGLYMTRPIGLVYTAVLGLLADAVSPAPPGLIFFGYLLIWLFFVFCHRRIRRQNPVHVRITSMLAQMLWLLGLSIFLSPGTSDPLAYWQRVFLDTGASCLLVYFTVWPICTFQKKLLYSMGWDLEAQMASM